MFEFTWFDEKRFTREIHPQGDIPEDFIILKGNERSHLTYWSEHCLECAAPECYGVCTNWQRRYDGKCRLYAYGMYLTQLPRFPQAAQIKFRPWGKMRTRISNRVVNIEKENSISERYVVANKAAMKLSRVTRFLSKRCIPNKVVNHRLGWYLRGGENQSKQLFLLLQIYSEAAESYCLFVDISAGGDLVKRLSLTISRGYNQLYADVSDIPLDKELAAEMYPENSMEVEAVFLNAEFLDGDIVGDKNSMPVLTKKDAVVSAASKIKCVAWDLDNTIWNGTLVESEPGTLKLRDGVLEEMKWLDNRGIIQTVVSKNYHDDAVAELKRLGIFDYFVGFRINWNPKSGNITELADELNINVNTFALCDDSEFERQEVLSTLKCVRVYDEDESFIGRPEFDVPITEDAKNRRKMYQTESVRKSKQKQFQGDNFDFLRSCGLTITVSALEPGKKVDRAHELVSRTNQLNLSGNKYTKEEFISRLSSKDGGKNLVAEACDRYGAYGLIAYLHFQIDDESIVIDEYAMSCRVAKKYMESALVAWLSEQYGRKKIVFQGKNNTKNHLLIETLEGIGFHNESENTDDLLLVLEDADTAVGKDIVSVIAE